MLFHERIDGFDYFFFRVTSRVKQGDCLNEDSQLFLSLFVRHKQTKFALRILCNMGLEVILIQAEHVYVFIENILVKLLQLFCLLLLVLSLLLICFRFQMHTVTLIALVYFSEIPVYDALRPLAVKIQMVKLSQVLCRRQLKHQLNCYLFIDFGLQKPSSLLNSVFIEVEEQRQLAQFRGIDVVELYDGLDGSHGLPLRLIHQSPAEGEGVVVVKIYQSLFLSSEEIHHLRTAVFESTYKMSSSFFVDVLFEYLGESVVDENGAFKVVAVDYVVGLDVSVDDAQSVEHTDRFLDPFSVLGLAYELYIEVAALHVELDAFCVEYKVKLLNFSYFGSYFEG